MVAITQVTQSANPGELVNLFRLDATSVGDSIRYFCQGRTGTDPVMFGGQAYFPIDLEMSDFEVNAGGSLPQPKLRIANTDEIIQSLLNAFGDLVGCEIRRVRTWKRFLDGESDSDSAAYIGPDIFRLERKSDENPIYIEWELSASIDQEGRMLPGRQVIRDTCVKRYRVYAPDNANAASDGFVYSPVNPCSYAGTSFFTLSGEATVDPASDRCGRRLTGGCAPRFPGGPFPFGGFPGVARVRA